MEEKITQLADMLKKVNLLFFLVEQVSVLQVEFRILEVRMDYIVRS